MVISEKCINWHYCPKYKNCLKYTLKDGDNQVWLTFNPDKPWLCFVPSKPEKINDTDIPERFERI